MITQKELDELILDLSQLGLEKCKCLAEPNMLTGYGLIFDESFVSLRVAGTVRDIANDNFNLDNWEIGPDIRETDRDFMNELYEQSQDYDNDDSWHEEFQSRMYLSAVTALECIKGQWLLVPDNIYLGVWVSDSDLNINKAKSAIKRLNNRELYELFVAYIDSIA